jgi:hypothetical protein
MRSTYERNTSGRRSVPSAAAVSSCGPRTRAIRQECYQYFGSVVCRVQISRSNAQGDVGFLAANDTI